MRALTYRQLIQWARSQDPDSPVTIRLMVDEKLSNRFKMVDVEPNILGHTPPSILVELDEKNAEALAPLYLDSGKTV